MSHGSKGSCCMQSFANVWVATRMQDMGEKRDIVTIVLILFEKYSLLCYVLPNLNIIIYCSVYVSYYSSLYFVFISTKKPLCTQNEILFLTRSMKKMKFKNKCDLQKIFAAYLGTTV